MSQRTLGLLALIFTVPLGGGSCGPLNPAGPGASAEACCACLAENVCILASDEQTCTDDLLAGENPDREQRPFGEGIAVNQDCNEQSCQSCTEALL